jgi:hypothetical protein
VKRLDKYEYKLKLEQLKNLVEEKDYSTAAEIADTINWRKVKSAATLCMVGEIYDRNKQYENSREILLMAYERATVGRNIIYRLALVSMKMGNLEEAKEYYEEFLEVAPYDNLKYVLRYQLARLEGLPIEELIAILEEFKEREYTEEWAFELACLYHRSGSSERCVEVCDELVLWIGEGKYVERALELKMLYQPLNKYQEEKYREIKMRRGEFFEAQPEDTIESEEIIHETVEIPDIAASTGRFNTMNLQEELAKGMQQIMEASTRETVSDTMDNIKKIVEEIPYLQMPQQEEEAGIEYEEERYGHIETDEEIDGSLQTDFRELLAEDWDGQMQPTASGGEWWETPNSGQPRIEDVLSEWEKTRRAAEVAMAVAQQRKLESAKARALQEAEELMERLNQIIPKLNAGVSPQELLAERYLQDAGFLPEEEYYDEAEPELMQEEYGAEPGTMPEGYYQTEAGMLPEGYVPEGYVQTAEPGTMSEGYYQAEGGMLPEGYVSEGYVQNAEPGMISEGYYQTEPGMLPEGYTQTAEPGMEPEGYYQTEAGPGMEAEGYLPEGAVQSAELGIMPEGYYQTETEPEMEPQGYVPEEYPQEAKPGVPPGGYLRESAAELPPAGYVSETGMEPESHIPEPELPPENYISEPEPEMVPAGYIPEPGMEPAGYSKEMKSDMVPPEEPEQQTLAANGEASIGVQPGEPEISFEEQAQNQGNLPKETADSNSDLPKETADRSSDLPKGAAGRNSYTPESFLEEGYPPESALARAGYPIKGFSQKQKLSQGNSAGVAEVVPEHVMKEPEVLPEHVMKEPEVLPEHVIREPAALPAVPKQPGAPNPPDMSKAVNPPAGMPKQPEALPEMPMHPGTQPGMPVHPGTQPGMPVHPGTQPGMPVHPGIPVQSEVPRQPETQPRVPVQPGMQPGMPVQSGAPMQPGVPKQPETPTAVSEEPEAPPSKKDAESYLESAFRAAKASREEKNQLPKVELERKEEYVPEPEPIPEELPIPEVTLEPEETLFVSEIGIAPEEEPTRKLSEEQKEIFSYFVPVTGMEQQLCQVLEGVLHRKGKGGSSGTGNILIMGGRGSGKTVLATDIIKAVQKSGGHPEGKVGKITGESLNQKDLSQLIKKIAGGYLIIERAGEISQETATRLALLMDQDTDGLLFILEDTRKGIEKALSLDANFAKKFTERIKIPVFTSDELVEFAKAYAFEQECEIDDMGILALYNRISNIQKLDEATTLTEVKEIVDMAISSAERGGFKKLFGGKKFSPEGYLYLREKDFEE